MKNNTLFFHGTTADGRRFTAAGKFYFSDNFPEDICFGISICSPDDPFVKRVGRHKAEGRLKSDSMRGCLLMSLYFTTDLPEPNQFVGNEIGAFITYCREFETFTFKELKQEFNLD